MAVITVNIPDNFHNELLRGKYKEGKPFRFQILEALRDKWEWPDSEMPLDGRLTKLADPEQIEKKGKRHAAANVPLDKDGLVDFSAMKDPSSPGYIDPAKEF